MTMEADLHTLLKTICPRVFVKVAPYGTAKPFVTYLGFGGESLRFLDNTAPDKRNTAVQISVWSTTEKEALSMIRAIEEALCLTTVFAATPMGEPSPGEDEDPEVFGRIQRFSIWAAR